ncbi:MAG: L-fucose mutarotase [Ruminococcaceae bacterium]|nr:L-fucose mutarotase [Oscillospiraceae bacterium]
MLKNISPIIPPELLKILAEMGHGDELIIADGNFPSHSMNDRVVRCDGHGGNEMLDAILALFPLDTYAQYNAGLMQVVPGDTVETPIWDEYKKTMAKYEGENVRIEEIERFAFYERAKTVYAVVATGEKALYANLIIKKGVI